MSIAILSTGDEIVHGDTLNTNNHQIAQILSSEGFPLGLQCTCSDKKNELIECLSFLTKHHDVVILIGGLGPTTDDLTRFALAEFTSTELIEHPSAREHIETRLKKINLMVDAGNLQQCLFPKKAMLLANPFGTAQGCSFQWNNKLFILLPGPPRECLPMFNNYALPLIQQTRRSSKRLLKWRIFGLAESEVARILEPGLAHIPCNIGYRLETPYVEFKVRAQADLVPGIQEAVTRLVGQHLIASPEQKASEKLYEYLVTHKEPITIVDEATKGLLEMVLVKPATHQHVLFNPHKKSRLFFHITGLSDYWAQKPHQGTTEITIHYSNENQEGGETHTIPYRSDNVGYFAVEWLSYRLFHLINQLH